MSRLPRYLGIAVIVVFSLIPITASAHGHAVKFNTVYTGYETFQIKLCRSTAVRGDSGDYTNVGNCSTSSYGAYMILDYEAFPLVLNQGGTNYDVVEDDSYCTHTDASDAGHGDLISSVNQTCPTAYSSSLSYEQGSVNFKFSNDNGVTTSNKYNVVARWDNGATYPATPGMYEDSGSGASANNGNNNIYNCADYFSALVPTISLNGGGSIYGTDWPEFCIVSMTPHI
jgi:hypothetical protein